MARFASKFDENSDHDCFIFVYYGNAETPHDEQTALYWESYWTSCLLPTEITFVPSAVWSCLGRAGTFAVRIYFV